ncbi:MAG: response regulator [Candidatus Levyibacteriota bacterium]
MNKKILVVDDDQDILEPLSIILEDEGYVVSTTPKGEMTYTKVREFKPDLVLLDLLLSGSDGRKICKTLKEDKATKHLPIIMMSAHPGADADSRNCGADGFIAKPFELEDLLKILKKKLH